MQLPYHLELLLLNIYTPFFIRIQTQAEYSNFFCLFKAENIPKIFLNFRSIEYAYNIYNISSGYARSRYILVKCSVIVYVPQFSPFCFFIYTFLPENI